MKENKMMRVHGNKHIKRRNIEITGDYTDVRDQIREDFFGLCGYCGKNSEYLPYNYEIDHFVPQIIAPDRRNDYQNLVFACRKCNRSKSNKWPTKDKLIANREHIGFVDPVSEEYDDHLARNEEGKIVYKTELGKYIWRQLHFDIRQTGLFWAIENISFIQERFEELDSNEQLGSEEKSFYIALNKELKKIQRSLASQGE